MTVARLKSGPTRWAVPEENQSLLVAPAPDQVSSMLAANRELLWNSQEHQAYDLQGYTYGELLKICREELLQKAISYTRSYRDVALPVQSDASSLPIIVGGHQPDIFLSFAPISAIRNSWDLGKKFCYRSLVARKSWSWPPDSH